MAAAVLVYVGSLVSILWGGAHIVPVKSVVAGFGPITEDNRRIVAMGWIAEGLVLIFIGLLAALVAWTGGVENPVSVIAVRFSAAMLLVLAAWTSMTGAKTSILPMKICPFVKTAAAILLLAGSIGFA